MINRKSQVCLVSNSLSITKKKKNHPHVRLFFTDIIDKSVSDTPAVQFLQSMEFDIGSPDSALAKKAILAVSLPLALVVTLRLTRTLTLAKTLALKSTLRTHTQTDN